MDEGGTPRIAHKDTPDGMTRLQTATERLENAILRLEAAVKSDPAGGNERELLEALEVARKDNAKLRTVAQNVSARLDAVIGRLKNVLEA